MRLAVVVAAVTVSLLLPATVTAASVTFRDTIATGKTGQVSVTTRSAAAFAVSLRVPASGRTQLFLLGAKAPKGGPLLDTATTSCPRNGTTRICSGRYEPLPAGTYVWRVKRVSGASANVALSVRW